MTTNKNSASSNESESRGGPGKAATAAGLAAAAVVAGAIAVRAYRKHASSSEESIFHLRQEGEEWVLQLEGRDTFESAYETKEEGVRAARELARGSAPCELVIYRTDGSVQDRHHYE